MKSLLTLLFSFWLAMATTVHGQIFLSLDDCINTALENNHSIRLVKNHQRVASNNFTRGNAGMLPSLDLRSTFSGNINNTDQFHRDGGINSQRYIHNFTFNSGLQAGWMLFDGFRAQLRYKQLSELKTLSELNTRISVENTIAGVASEYYFFIQQRRLFDNLKYAVDLSRERVRIEQEHFLLGSGSKVRLLQAQVSLNADSSRLERQHEVLNATRVRLAEIMGLPDLNERFIPADTNIVIDAGLTYDALLPEIVMNNSTILAALHNIKIADFEAGIVKSRQYPYLNLSSGYGYTRNFFQAGTLSGQQTWGMNYGLTVGFTIYDGQNLKRLHNNAIIELENREITLERAKQQVMAEFITTYSNYNNFLRLLTLEIQNLEVARENLDIAFERYRLGGMSGFELREVQKDLLAAEERLLSIQYQAKMSEISLLLLSGRITADIH